MNFKNLTYKQKWKYLLIGSGVFIVLAYYVALSNTLHLYLENKRLTEKIDRAEKAPAQLGIYRAALAGLDDKLDHYIIDTVKNHENTLDIVSEFCSKHRLILKELPRKEISEEKDFTIETSILSVEGRFSDLLKLVYELEQKHKIGRLSSVNFKMVKDPMLKRNVLIVMIYIQNIRVNDSVF